MPELPEVEASRALIDKHCVGRVVTAVDAADDTKVFDGSTAAEVAAAFQGRRLVGAHRKGKQMWLTLEGDGPHVLMHFGMTGYIACKDDADGETHVLAYENAPQDASAWPPRFHKLVLTLGPKPGQPASATCSLAYCDARRFGKVRLVTGDPAQSEAISTLGFDPLTDMPDLEAFKALLAARGKGAARLKPVLLDQRFIAGVGNWVADEVLYHARLHPEQLLSALGDEHVAALHAALKMVIDTAVAADADASKFGDDWMFHVRWGKKAGQLGGHKIDHITVGSRTSCLVPALQKLVGGRQPKQPSKAAAKAAKQPKQKKKRAGSSDDEPESGGGSSAGSEDEAEAVKPATKRQKKAAAPPALTAAAAPAAAVPPKLRLRK